MGNFGCDRYEYSQDLEEIRSYIQRHRSTSTPFDLVIMGYTGKDLAKGSKLVSSYAGAGLTWWLESLFREHDSIEAMQKRIRQGPPRI